MAEEKKIGPATVVLVDDWRNWKRWWSLRWTAISAFVIALAASYPNLPAELKAALPTWLPQAMGWIALVLNGLSGGSRLIAQAPKDGNSTSTE